MTVATSSELRRAEVLDRAISEWRTGSIRSAPTDPDSAEVRQLIGSAETLWLEAGKPRPAFAADLERAVRVAVVKAPARRPTARFMAGSRLGELLAAGTVAAGLLAAALFVTGPGGSPGAVPTARAATVTATPTTLVAAGTPASAPH